MKKISSDSLVKGIDNANGLLMVNFENEATALEVYKKLEKYKETEVNNFTLYRRI